MYKVHRVGVIFLGKCTTKIIHTKLKANRCTGTVLAIMTQGSTAEQIIIVHIDWVPQSQTVNHERIASQHFLDQSRNHYVRPLNLLN